MACATLGRVQCLWRVGATIALLGWMVSLPALRCEAAAPTISFITNQVIPKNGTSGPIAFRVIDDGGPASVALTVSSSDEVLLPGAGFKIGVPNGYRDPARTLTVTPAPNRAGAATVTLRGEDGIGNASTRSFLVTVVDPNPNTPPTVGTIPAQFIPAGGSTGDLPFTIGDGQTPPEQLSVEATSPDVRLFPPDSLLLGGQGANRTLRVTPAAGGSGAAPVRVRVSDGELTALAEFVATVVPPPILEGVSAGRIAWRGLPHVTYTVQLSADLVSWSPIASVSSDTEIFSFSEGPVPESARFYRVAFP